jgi:hypothetical protein
VGAGGLPGGLPGTALKLERGGPQAVDRPPVGRTHQARKFPVSLEEIDALAVEGCLVCALLHPMQLPRMSARKPSGRRSTRDTAEGAARRPESRCFADKERG